MSMTNEPDPLGDMTPARFMAPDDWWRRRYAELDEEGRDKLCAGELSFVAMGADGVEKVPLEPPAWLVAEHTSR